MRTMRPLRRLTTPRLAGALAFMLAVGAVLAPAPAPAQSDGTGGGDPALVAVIESQLEAFGRGDKTAAFARAAPGIKARFGDPDSFMDMVRGGYAPLLAPRAREFLAPERLGPDEIVQRMRFVGPAGANWLAHYRMARQPDGSWKIAGVRLEELPGGAV